MLALLGHDSLDDLARAAVPASILLGADLDLPEALPEIDVLAELRELGHRNRVMTTMIGLGYYGTHTPQVVLRKVLENPAWYTAYTPYQPEISQGRLEALLNYQTMVCDLTGLPLANASLLDEATAAAEAMTVARRASKADVQPLRRRRRRLPADARDAADARRAARHRGRRGRPRRRPARGRLLRRARAVPGRRRPRARPRAARRGGARRRARCACVAADLLALVLLKPPGEMGADVVVGTSQRFGVPIGFGGPHAAYMSVRAGLERALPGRLVGVSIDADGNPALRLALQTREQHIRREKATSNICTAQVLLAVMASMYAVYHGREGLELIAQPHPPADGDPRPRPRATAGSSSCTTRSSTPSACASRTTPTPSSRPRASSASTCCASTRTPSASRATRSPSARRWRRSGARSASQADIEALDADDARRDPAGARAHARDFLTHPVFQRAPLRDADAALPAHALGPRRRARPLDDPARLLHDEAQRDDRDAGRLVARVLDDPPVRAARPGRRLRHADRRPRALAVRDHGLRRRLAAAERRLAGRVRRPARDPRLPPRARRRRSATSA